MSREAKNTLVNIIYEREDFPSGSCYEIFWYHWPRDGLLPWEDYEPIVFAYNYRGELCYVLVRRAWKHIVMNPDEVFWPPQVLFRGGSHHQFVRMTNDEEDFLDQPGLNVLNITSSNVTPLNSNSIPDWNISGLDGSIYDKIRTILRESCEP
ncbi:MAG TPA: hypothetical protein VFF30_16755 [Nitrososphaerales archaeon]|nr:hypothetical protein [Nitrososphaerales archaeon]